MHPVTLSALLLFILHILLVGGVTGNPSNAIEEACSGNVNCLRKFENSPYSCEVTE